MLMVLLLHIASATQFECNLGYAGNFYGEIVDDGACQLDAEPSGTFSAAWGTPERAQEQGRWGECQEGGSQVITFHESQTLGEFRHTWRYDERGTLVGESESGRFGNFACCTGTEIYATSKWRVGTLEQCTPVPVPDEGCDHAPSLGSSSALAAAAALLRRGASADARKTSPC